MSDEQWLLVAIIIIYFSDCVIWIPKNCIGLHSPLGDLWFFNESAESFATILEG